MANNPKDDDNEKIVVFVVAEGKAMMKEVETGISDYENIEILSGVNEGEQVVTGPFLAISKRLDDGDLISPGGGKDKQKDEEDED